MRALAPTRTGTVERDGVRVHWEEFGAGEPAIALLPTWSIAHSRLWKFQIPHLARHYRVITFDGRGEHITLPVSAMLDRALLLQIRERHANGVIARIITKRLRDIGGGCFAKSVEHRHDLSFTPTQLVEHGCG